MTSKANTETASENPTRLVGLFKDYFVGLDCLRDELSKKEDELRKILISFYKLNDTEISTAKCSEYLQLVSNSFDACNDFITSNSNKPITIDGHVPITRLVNSLKRSPMALDEEILKTIIDFWENIIYSLELFHILLASLEKDVYNKLSVTYSSNPLTEIVDWISSSDDQVKGFISDIARFSRLFPDKLANCKLLIQSCGTHIRMGLIEHSTVADLVLTNVAVTRNPLLRVIPDLEFKLTEMFRICKKWLDREETFVLGINQQIREHKLLVKEKETRILSAKDHQKAIVTALKNSSILCQNSKIKMKEIMKELRLLEAQIHATTDQQQMIAEETYKTKSMTEFLSLSISQTRKNYSLQMKKQRLQTQVTELETTLIQLDSEIKMLRQEMLIKSQERLRTKDKIQTVEKTYFDAKADLESYSQSLTNYKSELILIKQSLSAMEGLKLLKSSPEYIENVFGKQEMFFSSSIHLAPSLQKAISRRTQKINDSI